MSTYRIKAREIAGRLEADGDRPELNIVHLTLAQNGNETLALRYMKPSSPLPSVGDTVDYEVTGKDNRSDRVKVKPVFSGGGGARQQQQVSFADPERGRRIERQHSQEMSLRYIVAKGKTDFTFEDVQKLTDAFAKDLDGPVAPSDVPFDSTGL